MENLIATVSQAWKVTDASGDVYFVRQVTKPEIIGKVALEEGYVIVYENDKVTWVTTHEFAMLCKLYAPWGT